MMMTPLHWVHGPWNGRLAISARPRGGDWLADEIAAWREAGVDSILSHLSREEETDLDLEEERRLALASGIKFHSFPVPDREPPGSAAEAAGIYEQIGQEMNGGATVLVHCRQGIGRAALTAICLLILRGISVDEAIRIVSEARGVSVPETEEQRQWIERFAARLLNASAA
jgi:protein-tyrosine phosphatase